MGTRGWVHGANLNKNPGKRLVQRHAVDPCPPGPGEQSYHVALVKLGRRIRLQVDGREVLDHVDVDPESYGGGKFGFRQIYGSRIRYDDLKVYRLVAAGHP